MRIVIVSLIATLLLAAMDARASRQVRLYEANVSAKTDAAVQAQAALRQVLVRATGARDAANDPALAGVLAQAPQYVLGTRPANSSGSIVTVVFDGGALERDITAAGRTIWPADRRVVLLVLTGGPAAGAFESRRQVEGTLDAVANRRGLPINSVRPEVVGLPETGDIPGDAALAAAQRKRADVALVGYGDAVPNGGTWRWVLTASGINESWNGTLEEGINGAADFLSRGAVAIAAQPDESLLVEIDGVATLREYARVAGMLDSVMGVRSVQLAEATGDRTTFAVVTRTGIEGLQSALLATARLEQIDPKAGGTIAFRYHP